MKIKLILPALAEAKSPFWRPIWNFIIKTEGLNKMFPLLETILHKRRKDRDRFVPAIA